MIPEDVEALALADAVGALDAGEQAELVVVPDAGHSAFEPGILEALVAATDRFALR